MTSLAWLVLAGVALAAPASAARPGTPVVNVRDFGARGDGTADDLAAIAAADASAGDAFATVLFPPGTYLLSAEWRLRSSRAYLGTGAVLRRAPGAAHRLWSGKDLTDVTLDGLTFAGGEEGRPASKAAAPGGQCVRCTRLTVRGCTFTGFARYGLQVSSGRQVRVAGATFDGGGGAPGVPSAMLLFDTWPDRTTEDVAVTGSTFIREGPSYGTAAQFRGTAAGNGTATRIAFSSNAVRLPLEVDDIASVGVEFGPGSAEFTATGNDLTGGSMGFSVAGARGGAITGNKVALGGARTRARHRWDHKAFEVTNSADVALSGNVVDGRGEAGCGMRISRENRRVVASGNVITGIAAGGCGIEFSFSSDGAVTGNVLDAPAGADGRALTAFRAEGLVVQGNQIRGVAPPADAAVRIAESRDVHLAGNQVSGAFKRALQVVDAPEVTLEGNRIAAADPGAVAIDVASQAGGGRATVLGNAVRGRADATGILARGLTSAAITGNAVDLEPGAGRAIQVVARGGAPLSALRVHGNALSGGGEPRVLLVADGGGPLAAAGAEVDVEYRASAPPKAGAGAVGLRVWNDDPQERGEPGRRYVVTGWRCVAPGTPGTWVEERVATGR